MTLLLLRPGLILESLDYISLHLAKDMLISVTWESCSAVSLWAQ